MNESFGSRMTTMLKKQWKRLAISIVILFEVIAISVVTTYAWVETVSSIKIINATDQERIIDTFVYTDAMITSQKAEWTKTTGFIDLADYFKKSGDMHLSPASSANGIDFYYPQVGRTVYRKGNVSDKNTTYMSVTFRLKAETDVDFFFYKTDNGNGPSFSSSTSSGSLFSAGDVRVSVTAYSEGSTPTEDDTKIFAILSGNDPTTTATVVSDVNGGTSSTTLKSFASSVKGTGSSNRLFSIDEDETKIVTVNLWLQSTSTNVNGDGILSEKITISDLGLISSITPRHVTLVPGSKWRSSNPVFYAWCWNEPVNPRYADKLYKLDDNNDGTFSFDYPGNYDHMVFVRAKSTCTKNTGDYLNWNHEDDGGDLWNQTVNAAVPGTPDDPTYFITSISGSTEKWGKDNKYSKSMGLWENPAIVRLKYVDGQDDTWGTISGIYDGKEVSYSTANSTNQVKLTARGTYLSETYSFTAKASVTNVSGQSYSDYEFVGWFTDPSGTQPATGFNSPTVSGNTTSMTRNTPDKNSDTTFYAMFKKVRTLTIKKYYNGTESSADIGTVTIGGHTSGATVSSYSWTFNKDESVEFSATPALGYKLDTDTEDGTGIYSAATGGTEMSSPVTLESDSVFYARFVPDSFDVTAIATYSSDGSDYYEGGTGGSVKVGDTTAGATSTASVDYLSNVTLTASPASGYEFIGWYDDEDNEISANATYSNYRLNTAGPVDVYARFIQSNWYIGYGESGGSNWSSVQMTSSDNNTVTGTMTLTEGQDFSFKIKNTVGGSTTWYGANSASYNDITSTSFISNLTLSTSGSDIYMKGHAGTYTFSFNKSTKVLNVTASYSNITITLNDNTSNHWLSDDEAIFYLDCSGYTGIRMTPGTNQWTAEIPSNTRTSGITFKRNNKENTSTYNSWSWNRGYGTTYDVND